MSIEKKVVGSISWLAIFKFGSQAFSWMVTIIVARLLVPDDYGLLALATIITGYAEIFSELGLGAAIIQSPKLKDEDLSSIFWFGMLVSLLFAAFCFVAAPLTASLFNEPRVIVLTQAVSIIFILSGLQIVPLNLLKKEMDFKQVGLIEMIGVVISCTAMLIMAYMGAGVWTLLLGRVINGAARSVLLFMWVNWRPQFHFAMKETLSYVQFGVLVAAGRSSFYAFEKTDRFFAGRVWEPQLLGYYTFAKQLASIPTEKVVALINQVSFSAFSQLQDDKEAFNRLYIKIVGFTATVVFPLYVGGYLVGEELFNLFLGEQWAMAVPLFKVLCLAQIVLSLNAINNFVHIARGEPKLGLFINVVLTITMGASFYFAVQHGLQAITIPWVTTFVVVCVGWMVFTMRRIGASPIAFLANLRHPFLATLLMYGVVVIGESAVDSIWDGLRGDILVLAFSIVIGGGVYLGYFLLFNRQIFSILKEMRG